jgi:hypothetical protein
MDVLNVTRPDTYIGTALRATFDLGNLTADHLTESWMGDRAVGSWKCQRCGTTRAFSKKVTTVCNSAGTTCDWKYQEVQFFGESTGISGSLDLIADLDGPKYKIVELKIIKADDFEKLAAPLSEHRLRTRLYMKLVEDSTNPIRFQLDTQKALVLYVCRGFGKMHPDYGQILPFKCFEVERDDASIEKFMDNGLTVKLARENNTIPIEKTCDSVSCSNAKKCPVKAQCWSGEYA